ncbi:MAG: hypothetical protein IH948_10080 [Bacteroidetes bacterium]|nr:hypothetical protein [Bacteroidota bacterium]
MTYDKDYKYHDKPSKLTKSKMTKCIWIQVRDHFELWKVEKLIKPNKYQTFILLSYGSDSDNASYFRGKDKEYIKNISMYLLEDGNDYWYNNTKEITEIMKKINKLHGSIKNKKKELRKTMYKRWLEK